MYLLLQGKFEVSGIKQLKIAAFFLVLAAFNASGLTTIAVPSTICTCLRPAFAFPGRRILIQGRHAEIGI
ncbi:uncharacterized protein An05g00680 [Aspergillus niger]|uniref:Contig An05c0030, genomic contig n=2 Tax=Aspergillus niger TaxID=5061 RepID=A2QKM2_ASPNC|nr:uncharacterized protein An05g00680 [Aspergillus niger]CAK39105.1 unnamed protein product [Aspergillus niger]